MILYGAKRQAVLLSPEFFNRAINALEDRMDSEVAAVAGGEGSCIPFDVKMDELGL